MKVLKYIEFVNENLEVKGYRLPTYDQAIEMCSDEDSPFYEIKTEVDGYNVSFFNYRLAQYKDFVNYNGYEMRGLTFIFNTDGSVFNRYLLLEKFFNLNQVPESMYSIVKNYKIKYVNNKEDGSIASFVKFPNGKVLGKSKMSFESDQAIGIDRVYKTNSDIKKLVDWTLDNDIVAIFEYVAPQNRIVLRYSKEELILLRLRDNKTGKHIDLKDHLDKIGSVKIAPFEDEYNDLDHLIEVVAKQEDKEGVIVQTEDINGNDFFFKLKTPWYCERHGLLTEDLYRENVLIGYVLDDKIDDILGQIPEDQVEAHERIEKIIAVIKKTITEKVLDIQKSYQVFLDMGSNHKEYALKHNKDRNFGYVMSLSRGKDVHEMAKEWIRDKTKRLLIARSFLTERDPSIFFQDEELNEEDN